MKEIKPKTWVLLGLTALMSVLYFFLTVIPERVLNRNHRFTIGYIIRIESQSEGGPTATFYYHYNRRTFSGVFDVEYGGRFKKGSLIAVKFCPADPENAMVLVDSIVPENGEIPENGWKKYPSFK